MRIISFLKKRKTYYIIRDLILYNSKEKKNSFIYIYIYVKKFYKIILILTFMSRINSTVLLFNHSIKHF